jgi:hypothetical protein
MQTKLVDTTKRTRSLRYKVRFEPLEESLFGVANHRYHFIKINSNKPKCVQIYTLVHERIHHIMDLTKLTSLQANKLHDLNDLVDYFLQDFQFTYKNVIKPLGTLRGFRFLIANVINRYEKQGRSD